MKKLRIALCAIVCTINIKAQTKSNSSKLNKHRSYYCLIVKGEEQVLVRDGKEIKDDDVKLKSGDRISIEGRIRKVDGTEIKLKEGECVNENGEVINTN